MKKYVLEIISYFTSALEKADSAEIPKLKEELALRIAWIQHERLIHLIVTCLFATVLFFCLIGLVCFEKIAFAPLVILVLVLLIPYIAHYYFLENNTQGLYRLYDKFCEKETSEEN